MAASAASGVEVIDKFPEEDYEIGDNLGLVYLDPPPPKKSKDRESFLSWSSSTLSSLMCSSLRKLEPYPLGSRC